LRSRQDCVQGRVVLAGVAAVAPVLLARSARTRLLRTGCLADGHRWSTRLNELLERGGVLRGTLVRAPARRGARHLSARARAPIPKVFDRRTTGATPAAALLAPGRARPECPAPSWGSPSGDPGCPRSRAGSPPVRARPGPGAGAGPRRAVASGPSSGRREQTPA